MTKWSMLAFLGIYVGSFLVLASPALFRKQTRGWVIVLMLVVLGELISLFVGQSVQRAVFGHALHWQWGYKIVSLAFGLVVAIILIAAGKFRSRELGLSFLQAPGTGWVLLIMAAYFSLTAVQHAMHGANKDQSLETFLFQATMPGLTEELYFRGLFLALFDRMFTARLRVLGAEIGYGAFATSLVFGLGHALNTQGHFGVDMHRGIMMTVGALILVWIRCRTRSLVLPVVFHNLGNVINCIPKMI